MKLGANSVLFGGHNLETAFTNIQLAGYDGIEISAINGMSEHLVIDRWQECVPLIRDLAARTGLALLAMEQPSQDFQVMKRAMEAAVAAGIPVINCGPGGKSADEESFKAMLANLKTLAKMAEDHGVTLCVKAHVGAAMFNTPTALRVLESVDSPAFGLDMDPSHIHRAGENPVEALAAVVSRIKHVHIRDCKGRQQNPGTPAMQANGRGDIDLLGFIRVLHEAGYTGAVNLEVIGAKAFTVTQCALIAAESRGHMQACLQACGAR
jgi:sugar phosphate isomerase/epimerase